MTRNGDLKKEQTQEIGNHTQRRGSGGEKGEKKKDRQRGSAKRDGEKSKWVVNFKEYHVTPWTEENVNQRESTKQEQTKRKNEKADSPQKV